MGPLAIAKLGLAGLDIGSQLFGNSQQSALQQAALAQQRADAQQRKRMALADRTDEYGNRQFWNGAGFQLDLSPLQQALLDAEQSEDYKTLTTDATQARDARTRKDERSRLGDDAFRRAFVDVQQVRGPDVGKRSADIIRAALADREAGMKNPAVVTSNVRQRMSPLQRARIQGGQVPTLERTLLTAEMQGEDAAATSKDRALSLAAKELGMFKGIADDTTQNIRNTRSIGTGTTEGQESALRQAVSAMNVPGASVPSTRPLDFRSLNTAALGAVDEIFGGERPPVDQFYGSLPAGQQAAFFEWLQESGILPPQDMYRLANTGA